MTYELAPRPTWSQHQEKTSTNQHLELAGVSTRLMGKFQKNFYSSK